MEVRNVSDGILIVSFGGPEKREDVIPFLENVLAGKNVPRERMLEVAEHYYHFGGKSPINEHNRVLLESLKALLAKSGPALPVYWGNRNWHPMLADTLRTMANDGITRAFAFVTSAFGSYSGCRQYQENINRARQQAGPNAPEVVKLRIYYNHPGFIEPMADHVRSAMESIPAERRSAAAFLYTAHSIPIAMAQGSPYVGQLTEACQLVSNIVGVKDFRLVYQSRSGPPSQPWLEPDVLEALRAIAQEGKTRDVIVIPIGFVSDHMEVLFDLDTQAKELCAELGLNMVRAGTVGNDPRFVEMIRELALEKLGQSPSRKVEGSPEFALDPCADNCCPAARRPT
jgi:ferrochelatase